MQAVARGDIILTRSRTAPHGAVVVQSDLIQSEGVIVCPLTEQLTALPLPYRLRLPGGVTGGAPVDVMADYPFVLRRDAITGQVRRLTTKELRHLDRALRVVLHLTAK